MRLLRKFLVWRRIQWAEWDCEYWRSARDIADANLGAAERRLGRLRQRPNEIDYPLPNAVRR